MSLQKYLPDTLILCKKPAEINTEVLLSTSNNSHSVHTKPNNPLYNVTYNFS